MKRILLFGLLSIFLAACSPYKAATRLNPAGYTDEKIEENEYLVRYVVSGFTSKNKLIDLSLLRASEITLENNYAFFKVDEKSTISYNQTRSSNLYFTLLNEHDGNESTYNASEIKKKMYAKYDIVKD